MAPVAMQSMLTLMASTNRDIPIPTVRKHVQERMLQNLKFLTQDKVSSKDEEELNVLCNTIDSKSCFYAACLRSASSSAF